MRATSETLAPGSSDAATSRSFSSCDHRRRRSNDVITSALEIVIALLLGLPLGPAAFASVKQGGPRRRNTMYDDAWMPHITWNGIALHGGPLPGYAASHGCVRLPFGFAERLYDKTRIGMRVIVSPNDAAPIAFSHASLLVPDAEAVAAAPARAETLAREAEEAAKAADSAKKSAAVAARE